MKNVERVEDPVEDDLDNLFGLITSNISPIQHDILNASSQISDHDDDIQDFRRLRKKRDSLSAKIACDFCNKPIPLRDYEDHQLQCYERWEKQKHQTKREGEKWVKQDYLKQTNKGKMFNTDEEISPMNQEKIN